MIIFLLPNKTKRIKYFFKNDVGNVYEKFSYFLKGEKKKNSFFYLRLKINTHKMIYFLIKKLKKIFFSIIYNRKLFFQKK